MSFPPDQSAALAYQAACTPDLFLFDGDKKLVYRGQPDASRPGNGIPVTGKDLRAALDAVLGGRPVAEDQVASIGCNIKWKPGNEPEYAKYLFGAKNKGLFTAKDAKEREGKEGRFSRRPTELSSFLFA